MKYLLQGSAAVVKPNGSVYCLCQGKKCHHNFSVMWHRSIRQLKLDLCQALVSCLLTLAWTSGQTRGEFKLENS